MHFVSLDEIPEKRFSRGENVGGRRSPRTLFKRFMQLWPGFKAAPRFTVNSDGQLEYRAADGCVEFAPGMLFPGLPTLAAGHIVEVDF